MLMDPRSPAGRDAGWRSHLYPAAPSSLLERMWQATFTVDGARRAGAAGDGLLLSRTQPRPKDQPHLTLADDPESDDRRLSGSPAAPVAIRASSPHAPSS
jgi:hypothetical protein